MAVTTPAEFGPCPLCSARLLQRQNDSRTRQFTRMECPNCGDHDWTNYALALADSAKLSDEQRARISFGLHRVSDRDALITDELMYAMDKKQRLPDAHERIDNLLLHMASRAEPGIEVEADPKNLRAAIWCIRSPSAEWVINQAAEMRYIATGGPKNRPGHATLTALGWQRYSELMRNGARSRNAFMAMKFKDPELDSFFKEHLQPAVAQTGFTLRTTDGEHATAGSIDDRMRVEIRTSRLLLCDLTHANNGAYWEAGFAEGLGRPVFYICRHNVLADNTHGCHPHFDTSHQLIIPWDPTTPAAGVEKLKSAIRATLPDEATMSDADALA